MQSLRWYWNRVALMPPGEILWRCEHALTESVAALVARIGYRAPHPKTVSDEFQGSAWVAPARHDVELHTAAAEKVLAGYVDLYGEWVQVGRIPDWNKDPIGAKVAPLSYGKLLDYRDADLVGSARNTWELNRHFQFVTLAQAWALTGADRYRQGTDELLASWLKASPYPLGINWASALEHGIRLINWYIAARILDVKSRPLRCSDDWLVAIYRHCQFIWNNQSRYSSANNHLIGEMAGLYIASAAWPCWEDSSRWRREAKRILLEEVQRQVHADGVSCEQTTGYQAFVLQFLIIAGLVGEAHDDPFPADYWITVRRMMAFLRSIMNVAGTVPDFGDSDDGMAYLLVPAARQARFRDLLEFDDAVTGASMRGATRAPSADWLQSGFDIPKAWPTAGVIKRRDFSDGGYYVLGGNFGAKNEISLVFDAAPLGYLSIAAHGHADCLSFVLSLGGQQILIDPGTYCYHSEPGWRDYFRSTAAHNTVRVDGADQSEMGGPFMWLRKAQPLVEVRELDSPVQVLRARHDGYRTLADPVLHSRELRLDVQKKTLTVIDTIDCKGAHLVERFWHFGDSCQVEKTSLERFLVSTSDVRMQLDTGPCETSDTLRGSLTPKSGWISRAFGSRQPTNTLTVKNQISGLTVLHTEFRW